MSGPSFCERCGEHRRDHPLKKCAGFVSNDKPSVMGRIRELVTDKPTITNEELFKLLAAEFPQDNPRWLRTRISGDRYQITKKRR